ncbi:hypothetical protein KKD49_14590 [Myxococcota bacterium]|nr:hypothetical protein [Myxococcota bacterium]
MFTVLILIIPHSVFASSHPDDDNWYIAIEAGGGLGVGKIKSIGIKSDWLYGGEYAVKIYLCGKRHCLGWGMETGSLKKTFDGKEINGAMHLSIPPFSYRYHYRPFFGEISTQLVIFSGNEEINDISFTVLLKMGVIKDFRRFRIGGALFVFPFESYRSAGIQFFAGIKF